MVILKWCTQVFLLWEKAGEGGYKYFTGSQKKQIYITQKLNWGRIVGIHMPTLYIYAHDQVQLAHAFYSFPPK